MTIIKVENVSLGYEGKHVISHLSFSVEKGDYVAILGENGSGKSTLIHALLGFNKPMEGTISFFDKAKGKKMGFLPQQSDIQKDFPASVKEVVLSGTLTTGRWFPFYTKEQKHKAKNYISLLGIEAIENKPFFELSGGQKQRVLLARALCAADEIIILDEPVSGLDPVVTSQLYEVLKKINNEGITVVMVSHDVDQTLSYANKVLHIDYDNSFFGSVEEYTDKYRK